MLTVGLNRPAKRNALNDELISALKDALREADADENLRAIVIRGAGKVPVERDSLYRVVRTFDGDPSPDGVAPRANATVAA